jgi:YVTN family beta-propeller protein
MNVLLLLVAAACLQAAENPYRVLTRYQIGGEGGFDYVTFDDATRRLYLSHATQVDVIDADTGSKVGVISDTPGVHGIAITPRYGFTTNGREHKVTVFDPKTLALVKKIDVGKGPDSIYFDRASGRVFTGNHGSNDITAIDAKTAEVVGTVDLKGAAESMITAKDGLIYVNVEDTAEVGVFDPKTLAIVRRMPIGSAKVPTGLAYDAKRNHLFIGCRDLPLLVVMDAASGKTIATFTIGTGVDWAIFDDASRVAFASSGDGTLSAIRQTASGEYEDLGELKTQPTAKTMAFDPKTKRLFLPAAEVEMVPASEAGGKPRRTMKSGTFTVLVVGR